MKVVHLYTGADGQSHIDDVELALDADSGGQAMELRTGVQGFGYREIVGGFTNDYHTAPRRQLVIQLSGLGELICGDGTACVVGPGDIVLADDTTGQGHTSKEIEGPRRQLYIHLDPDLDLRELFGG